MKGVIVISAVRTPICGNIQRGRVMYQPLDENRDRLTDEWEERNLIK